ncbi:MAG: WG repeat-containing protein [Candidatus Accumulibacter sp.]|nr:WG repeat-containing protein [Accumulibacter sp.]
MNAKGEEVIPPRFDCIERFVANGLAWFRVNGKRFRADGKSGKSSVIDE